MEQGKKFGVLVGCNYRKTRYELHGCINDVLAMHESLVTRFGFCPQDIVVLMDDAAAAMSATVQPTGANIKTALARMVDAAKPGDVLIFHYSGHGTLIPSLNPKTHPFREDEAIVPCDFNLITDMDLRVLVNRVPKGATFTIISDSCHSGGLIHKEKEQIGPSTKSITTTATTSDLSKEEDQISTSIFSNKPKRIPIESILNHVASLTSIKYYTSGIDMRTVFLELFGSSCSLCFRHDPIKPILQTDEGILLSGCQKNESCADIRPTENGINKKAYGAFSYAIESVIKENYNINSGNRGLSNREVVLLARKALESQHNLELQQHPCLYCSDENANTTFLGGTH